MNLQFVSFLVADGLQSVDEMPDDLHPDVLGLLVLGHEVQLSDVCCRLENYREGRLFIEVLNLRTGKYSEVLFKNTTHMCTSQEQTDLC